MYGYDCKSPKDVPLRLQRGFFLFIARQVFLKSRITEAYVHKANSPFAFRSKGPGR
jgi:hypothetical protein